MTQRQISEGWRKAHAEFTQLVGEAFRDSEDAARPPETLFHFTDCDGLIGILESRTLWASLANALNDKSELQYGRDLIETLLEAGKLPIVALPLVKLNEALERQSWRVFVFSFCARIDTALQWLHYGRSGSGVAMGFRSALLNQPGYRLYPVEYERRRQVRLLVDAVSSADRALAAASIHLSKGDEREFLAELALDTLATQIWLLLPRMKDRSFAAEQEWRLVASVPIGTGVPVSNLPWGPTRFRSRGGRIVPYKELKFEVLPVVEIIEGASAQTRQEPMALKVLLESTLANSDEVRVTVSPVPVRP